MSAFIKYFLLLFFIGNFIFTMGIAMDSEQDNEKKGAIFTKSFIPKTSNVGINADVVAMVPDIIANSTKKNKYPEYTEPKGILCLDSESQMYCYREEISLTCKHGEKSYLAVGGKVSKNSYQSAFFADQDYLNNNQGRYSSTFTLIPEKENNSYRIQSNFGEKSYLVVGGKVSKNSYQSAFFADQDYLNNNQGRYSSTFTLIPENNSYRIQSNFGEKSYLSINGRVSKNNYQSALGKATE